MSVPAAPGFADGLDPRVPHPSRVYAYWLGGKDHYPADRRAAEEVMRLRPQVVASARANRAFLARVVAFLAGPCGVRQFLDIGTGLPAPDNTHEMRSPSGWTRTAGWCTATTTRWSSPTPGRC